MGIKQTLNENPRLTTGLAVGLIAVSALLLVWYLWPTGTGRTQVTAGSWYYTDDDGATTFPDAANRPTPFTGPKGKEAVRVRMFQWNEKEKPVIGWLEKFTPEGKKQAEAFQAQAGNEHKMPVEVIMRDLVMVKKPGDARWVDASRDAAGASRVRKVDCPPDSKPEEVFPK